jgi:hypothetical protein
MEMRKIFLITFISTGLRPMLQKIVQAVSLYQRRLVLLSAVLISLSNYSYGQELERREYNGRVGFVNSTTGTLAIPYKYTGAGYFSEGLVAVVLNGKCGFIDKTGREVIPFIYDNARRFFEELAAVKLNDKWGFINKIGNVVIPFEYNDAQGFSNGRAQVIARDSIYYQWVTIDKTGRIVE